MQINGRIEIRQVADANRDKCVCRYSHCGYPVTHTFTQVIRNAKQQPWQYCRKHSQQFCAENGLDLPTPKGRLAEVSKVLAELRGQLQVIDETIIILQGLADEREAQRWVPAPTKTAGTKRGSGAEVSRAATGE